MGYYFKQFSLCISCSCWGNIFSPPCPLTSILNPSEGASWFWSSHILGFEALSLLLPIPPDVTLFQAGVDPESHHVEQSVDLEIS